MQVLGAGTYLPLSLMPDQIQPCCAGISLPDLCARKQGRPQEYEKRPLGMEEGAQRFYQQQRELAARKRLLALTRTPEESPVDLTQPEGQPLDASRCPKFRDVHTSVQGLK